MPFLFRGQQGVDARNKCGHDEPKGGERLFDFGVRKKAPRRARGFRGGSYRCLRLKRSAKRRRLLL